MNDRPLILIADDDPDILELVGFRLKRLDYDVISAPDGTTALELARSRLPALAILDVSMPGLTGYAVTEALRSDPATAGIPVMLLTARVQEADVERGMAAGAVDYVTKPFSPQALADRVQALLNPTA